MRKYIDEKFLLNKWKYILQCIIVIVFISFILIYLDLVFDVSLVASLGATSFILFTIPHKNASRVQYIVGGYIIGILVGYLCFYGLHLLPFIAPGIWGAIAIGFSMFLMVAFNFEHPPAAAVALSIVISGMSIKTLIVTLIAITLLLYVRHLLRKWLIDLI